MSIYVETESACHVPGAVTVWMNVVTIQMKETVPPSPPRPGPVCVHRAPWSVLTSSLHAVCQRPCAVMELETVQTDPMRPAALTLPAESA